MLADSSLETASIGQTFVRWNVVGELLPEAYARFRSARPFPYVVLDGIFDDKLLRRAVRDFEMIPRDRWQGFEDQRREIKLHCDSEKEFPATIRAAVRELNAGPFLQALTNLTGIQGLIPDPYLWGGGLHRIEAGGKLGIHADFNRHPVMKLDRRLNLIVYLNEDWREEYGGHLELWDRDMTCCAKRILPVFNRTVIFATTDYSYHGHPDPLTCPPGLARKSIALYYYTNGRPLSERSFRYNTTLFRSRPGESVEMPWGERVRTVLYGLLPPYVVSGLRALMRLGRRE